ncbi:PREDICTED: putative FBD-associated F-box protein At5g56440 [Camelina sativa]|uniref:FBD-associated F-box protein At5g56440 n=1 Tax=Camelina sativa TaxID=90675 RepID=A0ABM0T0D1_CAMSA|nr:PREDICTED: putative FBD-associated F-box protein At5g56440 [Camelina sativa]
MSSICGLSDDLLVAILSLVKTKDAVATSLLSKRWLTLWKLVPRLDYIITPWYASHSGSDFIDNFLLLSEAPVLETMHLRLGYNCKPEEQERWVDIALARHVRVLELIYSRSPSTPMPFPRSLFTYNGLVVLRLQEVVIRDIPSTIFLQSLKTLSLLCVRFCSRDDELVHTLLSACPVLETLVVRRWLEDYVTTFKIAVPSLQSLYIMRRPGGHAQTDDREYIINAPSLKDLKVCDEFSWFRPLVEMPKLVKAEIKIRRDDSKKLLGLEMPKLVKAEIKIRRDDSKKLLGCIASAKHLSLCVTSAKQLLMEKSVENLCQLEYLELCTNCSSDWLCLLLKHSPKLRVLRFNNPTSQIDGCNSLRRIRDRWEEPCCVPECLVTSLETVEWIGYEGTETEKEVANYILEKACHLKKMTIFRHITNLRKKYRTLIDLVSRLSCSIKCRLEVVPLEQH